MNSDEHDSVKAVKNSCCLQIPFSNTHMGIITLEQNEGMGKETVGIGITLDTEAFQLKEDMNVMEI